MQNLIKVAVDAMGGDDSPEKIIKVLFTIIIKIKIFFLRFWIKK